MKKTKGNKQMRRKEFDEQAQLKSIYKKVFYDCIKYSTPHEAARDLGVSRGTVQRILDDEIVGRKKGGRQAKNLTWSEVKERLAEDMDVLPPDEFANRFLSRLKSALR